MVVGTGTCFGGVSELGFGGTCAAAVDAQAMLIQMKRGSFISNLLNRSAAGSPEILVQAGSHTIAFSGLTTWRGSLLATIRSVEERHGSQEQLDETSNQRSQERSCRLLQRIQGARGPAIHGMKIGRKRQPHASTANPDAAGNGQARNRTAASCEPRRAAQHPARFASRVRRGGQRSRVTPAE